MNHQMQIIGVTTNYFISAASKQKVSESRGEKVFPHENNFPGDTTLNFNSFFHSHTSHWK
jgi:hypothetical protein